MPINRIKDGEGRTRFEFEFSRRINGQRIRIRRSLPLGWTRSQADAYDRAESAQLYALATGVQKREQLIEDAVARYLVDRVPELKHGLSQAKEIDIIEPWFRGKPLTELPEVCAAYLKHARPDLAPATIKNRLRYLVAACRWGWKHHRMGDQDPGAGVVYPSVSNERQTYIDRAQMLTLAKACKDKPTRAMIRIAFYSGMRLSEIVAAEPQDGCWLLSDTKNGEPRVVPMHQKVRVCARYQWPTLFKVGYWFRAARTKAGMPNLKFHDLRHSAASAMINSGVDLYTVGAVLGHKSHASTRRYSHLGTEALATAVGKIGKRAA